MLASVVQELTSQRRVAPARSHLPSSVSPSAATPGPDPPPPHHLTPAPTPPRTLSPSRPVRTPPKVSPLLDVAPLRTMPAPAPAPEGDPVHAPSEPLPTTELLGTLKVRVVEAKGLAVREGQPAKPYLLMQYDRTECAAPLCLSLSRWLNELIARLSPAQFRLARVGGTSARRTSGATEEEGRHQTQTRDLERQRRGHGAPRRRRCV